MSDWPKTFAWTPGQNDAQHPYRFYPQYVNASLNFDGSCFLRIRAPEHHVGGEKHYTMGDCVSIRLPAEAVAELRDLLALRSHGSGGEG